MLLVSPQAKAMYHAAYWRLVCVVGTYISVCYDVVDDSLLFSVYDGIQAVMISTMPVFRWIEGAISKLSHSPRHSPVKWSRRPTTRFRTSQVSRFLAMSVIAQAATAKPGERIATFDTDSQWVGVDNRCSACITHISEDFVPGSLMPSQKTSIKGFGGMIVRSNIQVGTLLWRFQDDMGVAHAFKIPNSYLVPEGGMRLLSPQHWAKVQKHKDKGRLGTGRLTPFFSQFMHTQRDF